MLRIASQQNKNKNIFIQILFTAVNLMERLFRHEEYTRNSLNSNFFNSRQLDKGLHNTAAGCHSATWQPLKLLGKRELIRRCVFLRQWPVPTLVLQREQKGDGGKKADSDASKEELEQGAAWFQDNVWRSLSYSSCRNTQPSPQDGYTPRHSF